MATRTTQKKTEAPKAASASTGATVKQRSITVQVGGEVKEVNIPAGYAHIGSGAVLRGDKVYLPETDSFIPVGCWTIKPSITGKVREYFAVIRPKANL